LRKNGHPPAKRAGNLWRFSGFVDLRRTRAGGTASVTLTGNSATKSLLGGSGNDTITYFNTTGGVASGGAGTDTLVFNQAGAVNLSATNQVAGGSTNVSGFENLNASGAN
jgi:Ca2+-binding RTX toxin-like protein